MVFAFIGREAIDVAMNDRLRRVLVVATRSGEGPFTHPFADLHHRATQPGGLLSSWPTPCGPDPRLDLILRCPSVPKESQQILVSLRMGAGTEREPRQHADEGIAKSSEIHANPRERSTVWLGGTQSVLM
jgi:hypothetical protein